MVVLVTGSSGQLGQSLQFIAKNYPEITFVFCDSLQLDITDQSSVTSIFKENNPDYCINTAAYTAVDKAESAPEKAHLINAIGPKNLAEACKDFGTTLIHVSTDFVFDGNASKPYTEEDVPNPTGVYGQTKLDGERMIQELTKNYFIIRTSWVYSQFGNNFMKTMLRLGSERDQISVVNDQIGTPTNAVDLAEALLKIIVIKTHPDSYRGPAANAYGIYNFSNEGQCSWYDFAKKIFEISNTTIDLQAIPSSAYPTPAKRPKYSVLNKNKIKTTFDMEILNWEERLKRVNFLL